MNTIDQTKKAVSVTLRRGIDVSNRTTYDRLTIAGWWIVDAMILKPWRIYGFLSHKESIENNGTYRGRRDPVFDTSRKPGNMPPDAIVPVLIELRRPITQNSDISLDAVNLEVKITDLSEENSTPNDLSEVIRNNYVDAGKGSFKILLSEYIDKDFAEKALLNFCGIDLFQFVPMPKEIYDWRKKQQDTAYAAKKAKAEHTEQSGSEVVGSINPEELAKAICAISKEHKRKFENTQHHPVKSRRVSYNRGGGYREHDTSDDKKDEAVARSTEVTEEVSTDQGIPSAAFLSKPQKDLILMRLNDIEVSCDGIASYPVRRGRHTKNETMGIIEFSAAQLYHINARLKGCKYELIYSAENNVYALRNLESNLTFAFTKRDWDFIRYGSDCRRTGNQI